MNKFFLIAMVSISYVLSIAGCCFQQTNVITGLTNATEIAFSPIGCLGVARSNAVFSIINDPCSSIPTIQNIPYAGVPNGPAASPDGSCFAVPNAGSGFNSVAIITDPCNATTIDHIIPSITSARYAAFSPDGSCLAVSRQNGVSIILNPCVSTVVDHSITVGTPVGLAFSPDGSCLAIASLTSDTVAIVENPCVSTTIARTIAVGDAPYNVAFSPDGSCLAVANRDSDTVSIIVDPCNATTVTRTIPVADGPQYVAFSPDGSCLAVSSQAGNTISIIADPCNATAVTSTLSVTNPLGIAFSPDGDCLAVASSGTILIFQAIQVNIVPSAVTTCVGQTIVLSAQPTGVGPFTYAWSGPNGFSATTQNITISNIQEVDSGAYTVNVTSNGCVTSNTANVTVNPNPVVSISPASVTACAGTSVTLTANATGASPFTYSWSGPSGFTATTQAITLSNIQASNAGAYSVLVIDANNCRSTTAATVTVNAAPVALIAPAAVAVCAGSNTSLTASATGTGPFSYAWTGPNSFSATTAVINLTNLQASSGGQYTVQVTDGNTCTSSASALVTVNADPTVLINPSIVAVCTNSSTTLTAQPTGVAPFTYAWSGPNGFTATTQAITLTNIQAIDAGIYSVIVTDANTCTGNGTSTVTVNALPNAAVNPAAVTVCAGQSTQLAAQTGGPATYLWAGPNGFSSTDQTITLTNLQTVNAGNYTVTITDTNGCSSDATGVVSVNASPIVTVTPSSVIICEGQAASITANVTGTAPFSYAWSGPSGFVSTQQTIDLMNAQLLDQGIYTVLVTDGNGCTASGTSNVIVNGTPSVVVDPSALEVCVGSDVTFSAIVTGASAVTYAWTGPNGFSATTQSITLSDIDQSQAGDYAVVVTAIGCSLTAQATANLIVNPIPAVVVTSSASIIAPGESVVLTATPTGIAPFTLVWSDGFIQENVTGITTRTISPEVSTAYSVIIIDANGCESDPGIIIDIVVKSPLVYSALAQAILNKFCS